MDRLVFRIFGIRMAGGVLVAVPPQIRWDPSEDFSVPSFNSHTPSQRLAFSLRRDVARACLAEVEAFPYPAG
jgi:hypothetical protein